MPPWPTLCNSWTKEPTFSTWARRARGPVRARAAQPTPPNPDGQRRRRAGPPAAGSQRDSRARPGAIVSVDTYKAATARAALQAGAEIVNDVSGFSGMRDGPVCAEFKCGRGADAHARTSRRMAHAAATGAPTRCWPRCAGLAASLAAAEQRRAFRQKPSCSIPATDSASASTRTTHCWPARRAACARPPAAGRCQPQILSGHTLAAIRDGGAAVEARENASLAAMTAAILHGASIVRVHAVRPAVEAALIADAILAAAEPV
jgi:dihydropteroate synthase